MPGQCQPLIPFIQLPTEKHHRISWRILYMCFARVHTKPTHVLWLLTSRNFLPLSKVPTYVCFNCLGRHTVSQCNSKLSCTIIAFAMPLLPILCHASRPHVIKHLLPSLPTTCKSSYLLTKTAITDVSTGPIIVEKARACWEATIPSNQTFLCNFLIPGNYSDTLIATCL